MLQASLELLTSRAKWAKLRLLLREHARMSSFSVRRRIGLLSSPAMTEPGSVTRSGSAEESLDTLRSEHHEWLYESRLEIPEPLLEGWGTRFRQDKVQSDGTLKTDFTYQCAIYHQASIYSNGTSHVSVFDRLANRVGEFSYAKYAASTVPATLRLETTRYLSGTSLSLYGNVENTAGNLGHWVIDGISRLFLAQKFHSISEIDHIIVPRMRYGFQKESLLALGIDEHKIVEIDVLECVRCERLIVTSAPRGVSSSSTPGWLIDGFREALLPAKASVSAGRRIYISRRDAGSRKFVNEEEIIACLEGFGFEAVEMSDYGFNEKIALFAQAEMIIGLTGAGMTNMLLCRSDACVMELFPASYITYFYASMGAYLGLDYQYLIFDNESLLSSLNKYYGNLSLDIALLQERLSEILENRGMSREG